MGKEELIDQQRANEFLRKCADEEADVRLELRYGKNELFERFNDGKIMRIETHGQPEAFTFETAEGLSPVAWIATDQFQDFAVLEGSQGEIGVVLRKRKDYPPGYDLELAFFKVNEPGRGEEKLVLPENPAIQ